MVNARLGIVVLLAFASACLVAAYAGMHAGERSEKYVLPPTGGVQSSSASADSGSACRFSAASIRADLFGTPVPSVVKPVIARKQATPQVLAVTSSPTPDPLNDYSITGIGALNGERYVLFEDKKTKEGRWLKVGDDIEGSKIAEIDDSGVTLSSNQRMALNDKYDLTPLDKDAAYLGGRVTKHEGMEHEGTASKLAVSLLQSVNGTVTQVKRPPAEDLEKLNDDAFKGKVPLKEYHDRINAAAPVSTYNDIYVSYKLTTDSANVESFAVTKEK
jgi:hypothetical protein